MATARVSGATLLPSGKVLVAGGSDAAYHPLVTAELYDPSTGSFGATGSMATAHGTATLLSNGKVLVAGGGYCSDICVFVSGAELYDPTSGTFSATGSMTTLRIGNSATLLPGGKVLFAGGFDSCDDVGCHGVTSAELYDPTSGTFSATGSMTRARYSNSATLLLDGKVLVAGGLAFPSAELYEPASGTFTATGNMTTARFFHSATLLLDGRILIAGGVNRAGPLASAELFDEP